MPNPYAMSIAASISLARPTAAFRRAPRGAAAPRRASLQTVAAGKNILYDIPVSNNGARNRLIIYWKNLKDEFAITNPSEVGGVLVKSVADVLRDYLGLGERQAVGGDEKRHLALRVHGEVLLGLNAANLGGVCDGELIFYGQPVYDQSVPGTVVADGDVVEDILAG